MHSAVPGRIDFREPYERTCLERLRRLVGLLPPDPTRVSRSQQPGRPSADWTGLFRPQEYDIRDLLPCLLDAGPFDEYKAEYGQTLVCGYGRLGGVAVGVVANQHQRCRPPNGPLQYGGVIYVDTAHNAARLVMDFNQTTFPILVLQDLDRLMVLSDSA